MLNNRTIILGVTGSIAAYKAADIVSRLTEAGAKVYPVMTVEACKFIQPFTLQVLSRNPVATDLWKEDEGWSREPKQKIEAKEECACGSWGSIFRPHPKLSSSRFEAWFSLTYLPALIAYFKKRVRWS